MVLVRGVFAVAAALCMCFSSAIRSFSNPEGLDLKATCYRVNEYKTCKMISPENCGKTWVGKTVEGSCAEAGYPYCAYGFYSIEIWVDEERCDVALRAMSNAGFPNDGCGGNGAPLPCAPAEPVKPPAAPTSMTTTVSTTPQSTAPPTTKSPVYCHRLPKEGLCHQGTNDSCFQSYTGMSITGTCAEASYPYCGYGAYGIEIWANEEGAPEACHAMRAAGFSNNGCDGQGSKLPNC
jgi:hypothetical protein